METYQTSAVQSPGIHAAPSIPRILVIDDDREIRDLLALFLERHGFAVKPVRDAAEARMLWQAGALEAESEMADSGTAGAFSLVVLDLMLPGESGLDFARWLRGRSEVPIVMLTAMGEETDRITGLELGADDYIAKPFNPRELLARIRAVLRRAGDGSERAPALGQAGTSSFGTSSVGASSIGTSSVGTSSGGMLRFANWTLDPMRRRLLDPAGVEVALTGGEYDLLAAMVDRANRVLTRDMLLDLLRGRQAGPFDRAIDVAISRLRRKLEDNGRNAQIIKTVRGGGYVLAAEVRRV